MSCNECPEEYEDYEIPPVGSGSRHDRLVSDCSEEDMTSEYCCPQCGELTEELHEGYCAYCCEQNQRELDLHSASFDRWERITDSERDAEIKAAYR